jgi:hypothetical protein
MLSHFEYKVKTPLRAWFAIASAPLFNPYLHHSTVLVSQMHSGRSLARENNMSKISAQQERFKQT